MATKRTAETALEGDRAALYEAMSAQDLAPLWDMYEDLVVSEPGRQEPSMHWRWEALESVVALSTEQVRGKDADHRVLLLQNPHMPGPPKTTANIIAGIQCVLPGEKTEPHRHTPAALRVVLEGEGGATFVDGKRCPMHTGDFIVTPNWTWHCHDNDSRKRVTWVDILDVPLVGSLDAVFGEYGPTGEYPDSIAALPDTSFAGGGLVPVTDRAGTPHTPRMRYAWEDVVAALSAAPEGADGARALRYANPVDGGSVISTLDAYALQLAPGRMTRRARTTANAVCVVIEGHGESRIGEATHRWAARDVFTVPHWSWTAHCAEDGLARLVIVTDREVLNRLSLLREETA